MSSSAIITTERVASLAMPVLALGFLNVAVDDPAAEAREDEGYRHDHQRSQPTHQRRAGSIQLERHGSGSVVKKNRG